MTPLIEKLKTTAALNARADMIEVFIKVTGQNGNRTMIPGGPFCRI
jgi:hypothetical protein